MSLMLDYGTDMRVFSVIKCWYCVACSLLHSYFWYWVFDWIYSC